MPKKYQRIIVLFQLLAGEHLGKQVLLAGKNAQNVGRKLCPECGKKIKQKSLYGHLYEMHNLKSDLTTFNVCRKLVSELNLDFDNHDCGVDADDVQAAESQTHMKGAMDNFF